MPMMPRYEPPLWITFRGAAASLALAWVAWATGAGLFALLTREPFAEAAGVLPILLVGWVLARHVPSPQSCPVVHARPHMPQFAGSLAVTTHVVPQRVWPVGQGNPQRPSVQI